MIKNRMGILVPDTPVMRAIYPRLPNELPYPSPNYRPELVPFKADNLTPGAMLFYDLIEKAYLLLPPDKVSEVLPKVNPTRYATNYDTYMGTLDGVAHFCACNDAYSQTGMFQSDSGATSNYYRIEIDNTANGSITFSATSGNGTIASTTITWTAGDTMTDIVALFTAKNTTYITFAALADGKGVGADIGGYGANTLTVTASTGCTVTDLSTLAFLLSENPLVEIGDTYDPTATYTYLDTTSHKSFRGTAPSSILTGLVAPNSSMLGNTGQNYSYSTGINFAKFKSYFTESGDATFYADGVNGSTNNSAGHVMKKATFDANVIVSATGDALLMYEYYNHLLTDQSGSYAELRAEYGGRYGTMSELYDAYLMSHMAGLDANSGILYAMLNKGLTQTEAKADLANITYDYAIIPAYPPEHNAQTYGDSTKEGFLAGYYYHPEPADIALMFRDDIMALINTNIEAAGEGTKLTNGMYRGSCADYSARNTWCFNGTSGSFSYNSRYDGYFRSRPVLALSLS